MPPMVIRNMMTRVPVLFPFLALLILGFFSGCSAPTLREPNVTVKDITFESVSLQTLNLEVQLQVENPNPVGITLSRVAFDVYYETASGREYLGHGEQENLTFPKQQTVVVTIPVEIDNLQALKAIPVLVQDRSLPVVVTGTATVDLKITSVNIPFEKRKVISV
jgi:LEA14-like dessication related protein